MKKVLILLLVLAISVSAPILGSILYKKAEAGFIEASGDHIKWVDFSVPKAALDDALAMDIATHGTEDHITMTEYLAYVSAKAYGDLSSYKKGALEASAIIPEKLPNTKLYNYYLEAYGAAVGALVGSYTRISINEEGERKETKEYGLRAFSPIASGYYYTDYNDFGASRSYGYKRSHLGHDLLGSVGTPIIAVESGIVEKCGWNEYGGWRIGIRSFDGKRYYYYAHLRKNHPYNDIYEGKTVNAGEVIGYLGMTGYSVKENVNNIDIPHLHFGLQLIFDKEQIDGSNQIWIDVYALSAFLYKNRSSVAKNSESGEYEAKCYFIYEETPD